MNMKTNETLVMEEVGHSFGNEGSLHVVLREINFILKRGEVVVITGPSGSGKSTFLHIAGLLDRPTSGNVYLGEELCTGRSESWMTTRRRQCMGFVYQFHHLLPEFNVVENVMMPLLIYRESKVSARERALKLLAEVGMFDYADKLVTALSGGEQQRVAIARSIVNNPKLILADEPTGNLDPENAQAMMVLLTKEVREHDSSAIIVTHNMRLVDAADRALRLEQGRLVEL
jgi:lipoprotein-releasing system ATP-binding protein